MKLISLFVKITGGELGNNWKAEGITFNSSINICIGQNATGKSRVMSIIQDLSKTIINGKYEFDLSQKIEIEFIFQKENRDKFKYSFKLEHLSMDAEVVEKIELNDKILLNRNNDTTTIYSYINQAYQIIDPPVDKLVLHIRRDKTEFPFLEDLINWASELSVFSFSHLNTSYFNRPTNNPSWLIEKLNQESIKKVIYNMNELNYSVEELTFEKLKDRPGNAILVKEKGIEKFISEYELSQGMFRALGLLIYLENLAQNNSISTILIDDLGEGLDYARATKLGKLIVEKIENSNIQLIATSNDSFLMDVIPIKYWNILQREGNTVRSLNYQNSKDLFDKFRLTGLSNFDLFSSDYLLQKQ